LVAGLTAAGLLLVGLGTVVATSTSAVGDASSETYLWMLTADGGTISGIGKDTGDEVLTLTLSGVNDYATQFADRPARDAYVISTPDFTDRWDDWFGSTPPNAVLSYQVAGEVKPRGIVLEIDDPEYDSAAGTITFVARHLHRASDPHPDANAPIEVARRTTPASFRGASLFVDSAGDAATVSSLDPAASATAASPTGSATPAASGTATPSASASASPSASRNASSSGSPSASATSSTAAPSVDASALGEVDEVDEVASILGNITPTGVDLRDGWFTSDPGSTSTAAPSSLADGKLGVFTSKATANPTMSTFAYQVYELGAPTGIWVRGTATAYPASSYSRDTSSCDFFRGDPATGVPQVSEDSQPYECVMTYVSTSDAGKYDIRYSVAPKVWATVRGSIAPTGTISLAGGQVSAQNTRWVYNGNPVTGPVKNRVVGSSSTPDRWIAYHRNGDLNANAARVDFSYQIVDDNVATPYWVSGDSENYRGAAFDHDGTCTIYDGDPFTTEAKEVSPSPYSCTAEGANVDGRGDWKVDFTVSARPAQVVNASEQPVFSRNLLASACTQAGATCSYIPTSITDADLPKTKVSKKTANNTSEPVEAAVEWSYRHAVTNSVGVEVDATDENNLLVEKVTVAVKAKWSLDVTNTYTTTYTNTLTVPPGCSSWWVLSPAAQVVTGDFVVLDDGTLYRIKGVSWTLPEAPPSGNDGGLDAGTLTATSEPIKGSSAKCSAPAAGAAG
jgi:hypothetical protein